MSKLILFDVFSYSCMNCLRSLDFIRQIDNKYKKSGLKTIIIHPPEWEFEKHRDNIKRASKKYKINFPIWTDNGYNITKKLGINFWPTQILVKDNKIIYKHIGEGNYKKLENSIIKNLNIKNNNSKRIFTNEPVYSKFPTVYCGKRKQGKVRKIHDKSNELKFGIVYSDKSWIQKEEYLQSLRDNSSLTIATKGKVINFVAKSLNDKIINVKISINNNMTKTLSIKNPQLYKIATLKSNKEYRLTITANKNLAIYSFSFQ